MEIICKEKLNIIFWRYEPGNDWSWANLDEMIEAYDSEPYTELEYAFPVKREGTDEVLYHVFKCKECEKMIPTVDSNHEYEFCPYCGRAIWQGIDEERDL